MFNLQMVDEVHIFLCLISRWLMRFVALMFNLQMIDEVHALTFMYKLWWFVCGVDKETHSRSRLKLKLIFRASSFFQTRYSVYFSVNITFILLIILHLLFNQHYIHCSISVIFIVSLFCISASSILQLLFLCCIFIFASILKYTFIFYHCSN